MYGMYSYSGGVTKFFCATLIIETMYSARNEESILC